VGQAKKGLRLRGPLAGNHTAETLHVLLLSELFWAAGASVFILPFFVYRKNLVAGLFLVLSAVSVISLALLRRGYLLRAGFASLCASWCAATVAIVLSGGIRSPILVFYIALPILAAWLGAYRITVLTTVLCVGSALILAILQTAGIQMPEHFPGNPIGLWALVFLAAIVTVVPIARVLRVLKEGLEVSQRAQDQMRKQQAQLEALVRERTEELAERKRAERALRESEERFRLVADTAPVMIWVSDNESHVTFVNKHTLTFTGLTHEEGMGQKWLEMIHPRDLKRLHPTFFATFETTRGFQFEFRLRRADGEYRWVLCTGCPRLVDGAIAGHIGTLVDVTGLRQRREQQAAAQKLESLGSLAAGVAHDFNTLLATILVDSDLALRDVPIDSLARESIVRIGSVATRGAEIVKLLVAYAGESDLGVVEEVDLSQLVSETIRLMRSSLPKNVTVESMLAHDLPAVRVNAGQMRMVVMNLITNAYEAHEKREGSITAMTRLVQLAADASPNLPEGDYVSLEISDTGRGIAEEDRSRVFDPFYTTKFLGRGLGLAVVQGIARSHGGTVSVASTPGVGSTFEVLLPCSKFDADEV
jgi:PAS domain S-box-containing protein